MTHGKVLNVFVVCCGVTESLTIYDASVEFIGINFSLERCRTPARFRERDVLVVKPRHVANISQQTLVWKTQVESQQII